MQLETAIKTAIEYEIRIRDLYRDAAGQAVDPVGKRVFGALGEDEDRHVAYLRDRLDRWRRTGLLTVAALASSMPTRAAIEKELGRLETRMSRDDRGSERQMLSKALAVEVETSEFYQKLVDEMSGDGRRMFARFLEIENEHIAVVQAELDYVSQTGYWLDFKEFDME